MAAAAAAAVWIMKNISVVRKSCTTEPGMTKVHSPGAWQPTHRYTHTRTHARTHKHAQSAARLPLSSAADVALPAASARGGGEA